MRRKIFIICILSALLGMSAVPASGQSREDFEKFLSFFSPLQSDSDPYDITQEYIEPKLVREFITKGGCRFCNDSVPWWDACRIIKDKHRYIAFLSDRCDNVPNTYTVADLWIFVYSENGKVLSRANLTGDHDPIRGWVAQDSLSVNPFRMLLTINVPVDKYPEEEDNPKYVKYKYVVTLEGDQIIKRKL